MDIKKFLKPELKKFVLPGLLIIIFLMEIYTFQSIGNAGNGIWCNYLELVNLNNISEKPSNYNQTLLELNRSFDMYNEKRASSPIYLFNFITLINPTNPVPCEGDFIIYIYGYYCENYISKESFSCLKEFIIFQNPSANVSGGMDKMIYKQFSLIAVAANMIILFLEGYLASCVAAYTWRKFAKRK